GTAYIQGTGQGPLGVAIPGNENTLAGDGNYLGAVGDAGPATAAELYLPSSVALDGAGNLYIADSAHNRVRMVCASAASATISGTSCTGAGIISTIAGDGTAGNSGNGPAASSVLDDPGGISMDGAGNLYIADTGNNMVREIVASTGELVTVAGGAATVCVAATDAVGDGCPALEATLSEPEGVTVDVYGNLYIADTADQRIREVTAGAIATVAGTGIGGYNGDNIAAIGAELNNPYAVAFDAAGNLYIPDSANNRIRLVAAVGGAITPASAITTFAGTGAAGDAGDTEAAANAELWGPQGVALDAAGNAYIADTGNDAIRKVNASSGDISTLVRNGIGTTYVNGGFDAVTLFAPTGIALDGSGNLYIADSLDMEVRQIQSNLMALDYTTPVRQGTKSAALPATLENDGNAALDLTAINPLANAQLDPLTTTCAVGPPDLAVGDDCVVGAIFAPTLANNPLSTDIDVASMTVNAPVDIKLVGIALAANSTTTTVTSAPDPSQFGQPVTFTVTVATGTGTGNLTGTVSLADTFDGATTVLATGLALNTSYVATFTTATLGVGLHSIVASYSGDAGHLAGASTEYGAPALIQTVLEETATTLTSSVNPSAAGQNVTFTATVAISGGGGVTPTGSVTFLDGSTALATVPLATVGALTSAAYTTNALAIGVHPITAVYNGDAMDQVVGSTSEVLDQDVQATTTVALTSSLNPSTYGATVLFTATIASVSTTAATGTVVFFDGTNQIGSGALGGNPAVATFSTALLNVGTHSITATYAGDTNNSAGTSAAVSQVVNAAATTIVVASSLNPSGSGQSVTFTMTVTTGVGTGNLTGTVSLADTFKGVTTNLATGLALNTSGVTTFTTSTLAVGQHSIVATYGGDTNHAMDSTPAGGLIQVVTEGTATALASSANPSLFGQNVTFTATVTITGGGGVTPDGMVTFMDGAAALGTATLAGGVATFSTAALAVGVHAIAAVYGGDAANGILASTSAVLNQDVQAATTVTVVSSLNPSNYGLAVTFTATVA
ncbi:MAG: Ig-like domain repeat protein, partial [Terracidiphilus sp.]